MKKYAVKILSLVLCLSLISAYPIPAYAVSDGIGDTLDQYIDYANSILPDLSRLPDTNLPMDNLYISQPIELLNDNDDTNYVFFLFDGSTCVGELVVSRIDGSFSASFLPGEMPLVSAAYADAAPICLVSAERALLLCTESTADVIAGELPQTYASRDHSAEIIVSQAQKEALSLTAAEVESAPLSVLPNTSKVLPVDHVDNEDVDGGLCWAASTASIIRYKKNRHDLTARNVYDSLLLELGGAPIMGSQENVVLALKCYGITYYTDIYASLPFSTVINSINFDYPIYIAIYGTKIKNNVTETVAHAVVLCGYQCDSDMADYYQLMDPNTKQKVWIAVNRNTNTFTYATSGWGTYTTWYRSVYSSLVS